MRLTLRTKLLWVAAVSILALVAISSAELLSERDIARELERIRVEQVPRIALRIQLHADLERLARTLQDAVAAEDAGLLAGADAHRATLLEHLSRATDAIPPEQAAELRAIVNHYHRIGSEVARRLIAGETGEHLLDAIAEMQALQADLRRRIDELSELRPGELEAAFARSVELQTRIRLVTSAAGVVLVSLLTLLITRHLLRSVADLADGFERFGRGELGTPIIPRANDELGDVAERANEMAARLATLNEARERAVWLSEGLSELARELRGDLSDEETARHATSFLAGYLGASVGALYYFDAKQTSLELLASHAAAEEISAAARSFRRGEGLVGQAARSSEPTVVHDLPPGYLRVRSGLGETSPTALVLVPLAPAGETMGVLELAFLGSVPDAALELLASAQPTIAISIEIARARAAGRALLAETQALAGRLRVREEELNLSNEELLAQREELREANLQLTRQTDALEEQRQALARKNAELARMSEYKSRFLTNMSHDLRTPLNSMLVLSSLLAENRGGNLTEQDVGRCRTIHAAGRELLALIDQILDLAKIEAGRIEIEPSRVPLPKLLDHVAASFEPLARQKGLALHLELDTDCPASIRTDRQRVLQILNNLIGNAIKFTETGSVRLRVARPARDADLGRPDLDPATTVALSVTDTGRGIPAEDQARVFSAFEQVRGLEDAAKGGAGLGLAISRELAELLGGALTLESTPGEGSTFTCYLPEAGPPSTVASVARAARRPGPSSEDAAAPAAPAHRRRAQGLGETVLVVDEDMRTLYGLSALLRSEGYDVRVADQGHAALDTLAREPDIDVIVLASTMSHLPGTTLLSELRAQEQLARVPVIALTSRAVPDDEARCAAAGASACVPKPVDEERMLETLSAVLAPSS